MSKIDKAGKNDKKLKKYMGSKRNTTYADMLLKTS